jgi:hypothetical protein
MAKAPRKRGFVLRFPILAVVDRKTLWHQGLLAAVRTALRPKTREPILLLFTDRSLARRYIRAKMLAGSAAMSLEPAGLLRALLAELTGTGIRLAAVDHPTQGGHEWRPIKIAKIIAAIDKKLPPIAPRYRR